MSPVKWHLAHTTWFFETFLLSASLRANYLSDVGRLSARYDEIGDLDLHSLIILV
jgi:hypothetical protein